MFRPTRAAHRVSVSTSSVNFWLYHSLFLPFCLLFSHPFSSKWYFICRTRIPHLILRWVLVFRYKERIQHEVEQYVSVIRRIFRRIYRYKLLQKQYLRILKYFGKVRHSSSRQNCSWHNTKLQFSHRQLQLSTWFLPSDNSGKSLYLLHLQIPKT